MSSASIVGRVPIEADDIFQLFRELAIIAQLEGLHPGRNEAGASAARSVFLNPCDPSIQESPSPESCRLTGDGPSLGDLDVGFAGGGLKDDLGPLDQAGRQGSAASEARKVVLRFSR